MFEGTVQEYLKYELHPIPLVPDSKLPLRKGWQVLDAGDQWNGAPADANVGLRMGGAANLVALDADEKNLPGSVDFLLNWLAGLGFTDSPVVRTMNNGIHVYARTDGPLPYGMKNFNTSLGIAGEVRGENSYVVAPPSRIDGRQYELIRGDLSRLQVIPVGEINKLVKLPEVAQPRAAIVGDKQIDQRTMNLLLGRARYHKTRSEDDYEVVCYLVRHGFDLDEIRSLYVQYPGAGKVQQAGDGWLVQAYNSALENAFNESAAVKQIRERRETVERQIWTGRTGATDRQVYLAHLLKAEQAARTVYNISTREIALEAKTSPDTASRATRRLVDRGVVRLLQKADDIYAPYYQLPEEQPISTLSNCIDMSDYEPFLLDHDVWRWAGLNKKAGEIYSALLRQPQTITELCAIASRATVKRVLKRMSRMETVDPDTGEIMPLVYQEGKVWHANAGSLDWTARELGVDGYTERQASQFRKDREKFQAAVIYDQYDHEPTPEEIEYELRAAYIKAKGW